MKKKDKPKGERFELAVGAYFQNEGYFIRTSVPFRASPGEQPFTDIDVLGIKFTPSFAVLKILCDCKDKVRPKTFERILWTKGLAAFLNVSEAYVSVARTNLGAVKFGRMAGVHVLSDEAVKAALATASPSVPYGIINSVQFEHVEDAALSGFRTERLAFVFLNSARFLLLSEDPYVAFNDAFHFLSEAAHRLKTIQESRANEWTSWKFVTAEILVVLTVQLLRIVADTVSLTAADRKTYIKERLTYGNLAPDKARELFELATELAIQMYEQNSSSRPTARDELRSSIDAPLYADDVVGLVDRAVSNPSVYCELPQTLDFLLFHQSLPRGEFSGQEFSEAFRGNNAAERLKVAKNILVFARDSAGLQLRPFWPRHAQNLPSLAEERVNPKNVSEAAPVGKNIQPDTRTAHHTASSQEESLPGLGPHTDPEGRP